MTRSRSRLPGMAMRWLPVVAWMAVIFRLSAIPGSDIPGRFSSLGHFAAYFVLGSLLILALRPHATPGKALALAVFLAALYGISDEFHQSFVPMRTPDVADWGVDTLGAFAGAALASWVANRASRARRAL